MLCFSLLAARRRPLSGRLLRRWLCCLLCFAIPPTGRAAAQSLDERLQAESPAALARDALAQGDAQRGAIVFHQPYMACSKCHLADEQGGQLGPVLTEWETPPTNEQLVEAVLKPSRSIRRGFESLTLTTTAGKTVVGLIVEQGDIIVLRDPNRPALLLSYPRAEIDELQVNSQSLMPSGLANQLAGRQQFLDLIRYLMELRDGGRLAQRNLKPAPHLYAARPLPAYEADIDHAGLIRDLDQDSLQRGREIYERLCVNCHGTPDRPGSLPTSLRFASGQFKNGPDPYTMYQTLTRGFGMMQPQAWMVPQQKYDVIHYIRETYLKPLNPSQYVEVNDAWLASLPAGSSRGPAPQQSEPWVTMDYGRWLFNTYEVGDTGENFAYKGLAVRLDQGPGGVSRGRYWMLYDHDTMRMAAAWSGEGFIDWKGIHFNGQHQAHPRLAGQVHASARSGPGWAHPESGAWDDVRLTGRDGRRYGPLPRDWAQYKGLWRHGEEVVVSYQVGEASVEERPLLLTDQPTAVFARQLRVGARGSDLILRIADLPPGAVVKDMSQPGQPAWLWAPPDAASAPKPGFTFDGRSFAQWDEGSALEMTGADFTIRARIKTRSGGTLLAQTASGEEWVPDGKALFVRGGRLCYDIGWVGVVQSQRRVNDGKWHDVALTWRAADGAVALYVDGRQDGAGVLRPKQPRPDHVVRLGYGAANFPGPRSHFEGEIESLQFFAAALPPEQIAAASPDAELLADWAPQEAEDFLPDRGPRQWHAAVRRGSVADKGGRLLAGLAGDYGPCRLLQQEGRACVRLPAGDQPLQLTVWFAAAENTMQAAAIQASVAGTVIPPPLWRDASVPPGPPRYPDPLLTQPVAGDDQGPFAVDVLTRPETNPWSARVRLTGFDFFADGDTAAVAAWDGDVWKVSGVNQLDQPLRWRRIATGLFQPLGVKIVEEQIYVACRDQIVILRDLNGDEETDYFECFNNDHQVTEHFHEFAMGLQRDAQGNFYYAKSARHALPAVVPHHGVLLRVTPDGKRTDILATGFRAANGVCLNPDGSFIVTDQEGHWNPKNRINWVREGGFYGNMFGYHDVVDASDEAMEQPLCWITNDFDRSPAELLWTPEDCWGPLGGSLLNLSYGYGKIFVVPFEKISGSERAPVQGGMCELPLPQAPTGLIRGRFHPANHSLYACGMFAWAGNQQQPGGFYRVRTTGRPMHLPKGLRVLTDGLELQLTDPVDRDSAADPANYAVTVWDLKRTANYGSPHVNQRSWTVTAAQVSADGRTIRLKLPDIQPTWGMEIRCYWKSLEGRDVERKIHNTIHEIPAGARGASPGRQE